MLYSHSSPSFLIEHKFIWKVKMFKCTYLKVAVSGQKQANKHTHVCDAFSLVLSKNKIGIIVI